MDIEKIASNVTGEFSKTDFSIEGITFKINKLNAIDGHNLFEEIRYEFSNSFSTLPKDYASNIDGFFISLTKLRPDFVKKVRSKLFEHTQFKGNGAESWVKLEGSENMAFADLEPVHVYEVLVRCLAVNFTSSLRAVTSKLPGLA